MIQSLGCPGMHGGPGGPLGPGGHAAESCPKGWGSTRQSQMACWNDINMAGMLHLHINI